MYKQDRGLMDSIGFLMSGLFPIVLIGIGLFLLAGGVLYYCFLSAIVYVIKLMGILMGGDWSWVSPLIAFVMVVLILTAIALINDIISNRPIKKGL